MKDETEILYRVLVIDDERNLRESLARYLPTEGISALLSESGEQARELLETERVDAVVVDLKMKGMSGLDFLSWLKDAGPALPAIMISAHGEVPDAVEAMKRGASDYLVKPFDPDELVVRIRKVVDGARLMANARATVGAAKAGQDSSWIGSGTVMTELRRLIDRVAPTNSTVLVTGESGTGKEVVARRIHSSSKRADGPFVPINLGGIPENLLESELFGYERGAFTGAETKKTGLFELAGGGTLFLDEVGDMPLALQVKLLRVIQDRRIMRLGGTRQIPIDVRIVAATNRDLENAVRAGTFREDLFYRLNVIRMRIPPLRERPEDIPALALFFTQRYAGEMGKSIQDLDGEAMRVLAEYPFPGNVRELENAVERAVILCDDETLGKRDFSFAGAYMNEFAVSASKGGRGDNPQSLDPDDFFASNPLALNELERLAIKAALVRHEGHREKTAAELGITRRTLLNKMNEFDLS